MRLCPAAEKFTDTERWVGGVPALPNLPAAVPIYNSAKKATILAFDFDAKKATAIGDVERDVSRLREWIDASRGVALVDRSSSGGMHVLVPVADVDAFTVAQIRPLLTQLAKQLQTLDLSPMLNAAWGCITPPGSRCREGGYRRLDGTVDDALTALKVRSQPGLLHRLTQLLSPQGALPYLDENTEPETNRPAVRIVTDDTSLDAAVRSHLPLPGWIAAFTDSGQVPDYSTKTGSPWTASEARMSVLEHYALRGWTSRQVWDTMRAHWPAMWSSYSTRKDRKRRYASDWELAFDHARARTANPPKSRSTPHKPVPLHTGGLRNTRRKLATARKWILFTDTLTGRERWTALSVVNALAYGMSLTNKDSAAMGERWLSVAAGMLNERTVREILRKLRDTPGSPLLRIARHNGLCGDEYTLVKPHIGGRDVYAPEWEVYAARLDPIDPVWVELGRAAWHVWETMRAIEEQPQGRLTRKTIAAAGRISLSTVDEALSTLALHGLVDVGHGWTARTGRTVRQLGEITAEADQRRDDRIARHRRERQLWHEFIGVVAPETERWSPAGAYFDFSIDEAWRADVLATGPPSMDPSSPDWAMELAIELAHKELGAEILAQPPDTAHYVTVT